ncbi:MAG: response regulator [Opitutaceae bacterium]
MLLVEDHVVVREGLAGIVESGGDWRICGEAGDGRQARKLAADLEPAFVLLDFFLTDHDGFDLVRDLSGLPHGPRILVLSAIAEVDLGERVIEAGAHGFLNKRSDSGTLLGAMRAIASGGIVAAPEIKMRLAARKLGFDHSTARRDTLGHLSDREFEILMLIGGGLAVSDISRRLHLSVSTVETHREHIKNKLTLQTAAAVSRWARTWFARTDAARPSSL